MVIETWDFKQEQPNGQPNQHTKNKQLNDWTQSINKSKENTYKHMKHDETLHQIKKNK